MVDGKDPPLQNHLMPALNVSFVEEKFSDVSHKLDLKLFTD